MHVHVRSCSSCHVIFIRLYIAAGNIHQVRLVETLADPEERKKFQDAVQSQQQTDHLQLTMIKSSVAAFFEVAPKTLRRAELESVEHVLQEHVVSMLLAEKDLDRDEEGFQAVAHSMWLVLRDSFALFQVLKLPK